MSPGGEGETNKKREREREKERGGESERETETDQTRDERRGSDLGRPNCFPKAPEIAERVPVDVFRTGQVPSCSR